MDDPFNLQRFVDAQAPVFDAAVAELQAGRKRTHWMWFVFPQLRALGRSATAQFYGIGSLDEARAYLRHAVLGPRLIRCTEAALRAENRTLFEIFGSPDDLKFRSSVTLFEAAAASDKEACPFRAAIDRLCAGDRDATTLGLIAPARGM